MKRNLFFILLFSVACFSAGAQAPKNWSSADILNGLQKLGQTGSVLYIAAHPDDENTRLLSYLENEMHLRAGYLALTRGDGGQNLIGKEQGDLLGLIRTQELLAARRTDGAEQFFTRANDFGFSKNPEETFTFWNHDSILADVVWVIRNFQPDVIITRFATDGSGGHGHHTASAILAGEAFEAAADPNRFPEQLKYVKPWQAKRLLYNFTSRASNPNTDFNTLLKIDVGLYNPVLGKSYGELASESRSMHKSQGFGTAKSRGSNLEYFKVIKGDTTIKDVFQDLDLSWNRIKSGQSIDQMARLLVASYNPLRPSASALRLVSFYDGLNAIDDIVLRERKQKETVELILACGGIFAEAVSNTPYTAAGDTVRITTSIIVRSSLPVVLKSISRSGTVDTSATYSFADNQPFVFSRLITIPSNSDITNPYWLSHPHGNGLFTVPDQLLIGKPQDDAALSVTVKMNISGRDFDVVCPVRYKWVEPSDGERYRPFVIAPDVTINFMEPMNVFPSAQDKTISLRVKSWRDNVSGFAVLHLPSPWIVQPDSIPFALPKKGDEQEVLFHVSTPLESSEVLATAYARVGNKLFTKSLTEIKYDHIPVQTYFSQANTRFLKLEVKRHLDNIGYIPGAGDEVLK
jgi:LmbE family N-acetylglucosaminyl deacetylase